MHMKEDEQKTICGNVKNVKNNQNSLMIHDLLCNVNATKAFILLDKKQQALINNTIHVMCCDSHPLNKK